MAIKLAHSGPWANEVTSPGLCVLSAKRGWGLLGLPVSLAVLLLFLERLQACAGPCLLQEVHWENPSWLLPPPRFDSSESDLELTPSVCWSPKPFIYLFILRCLSTHFDDVILPRLPTELCCAGVGGRVSKEMMYVNCFGIYDLLCHPSLYYQKQGVWPRDATESG